MVSVPLSALAANDDDIPIEAVADQLSYDKTNKKIIGIGNVLVTYKDKRLTADRAEIFTNEKHVYAEGHVVVDDAGQKLEGDKVFYDFGKSQGSFPQGRYINPPYYGDGEEINRLSQDQIQVTGGSITTCDLDHPHYLLTTQRVKVYPGDKIVAFNVVFKVLGTPLAWVPYVTIPLDDVNAPFVIQPGYSSEFGAYVSLIKGWSINKNIHGRANLDIRQKRGVGFGFKSAYDYTDEHKYFGKGDIRSYITYDKRSPDPDAAEPFEDRTGRRRWRFQWRHRSDFDPYSNLIISHNNLSDQYLLQDFFNGEYGLESEPQSQYVFTRNSPNTGLLVEVDKQYNHFFNELERLPQVRFTINRNQIGDSNAYYWSQSEFVNYNRKVASSDTSPHVARFDTAHELSYPMKYKDVVVYPSITFRDTEFSRDENDSGWISRQTINTSIDVSTRFYKLYDYNTNFLGLNINKLRHIVEPYFNWDANRFTTYSADRLEQFDAIDAIDNKDVFQFGLENRFQTKRFEQGKWQRVDVVSLNTFIFYSLNDNIPGSSVFRTAGVELTVRPYRWLTIQNFTNYDAATGVIIDSETELFMTYKDRLNFLLSYRFLNDKDLDGVSGPEKSSLITADLTFKINDLWAAGGFVRYERESNLIEEWEIRFTRYLHCWILDFGVNARKSDRLAGEQDTNIEAFFQLTLSAFPGLNLETGNRSTMSNPRIGTYVAGANEKGELNNVLTARTLRTGQYGRFQATSY